MSMSRGRRFGLGSFIMVALSGLPVMAVRAEAPTPQLQFAIPAGPLPAALQAYASVTGEQLMYSTEMVAGRRAASVVGHFTPAAALDRLLSGTSLKAHQVGAHVFVIRSAGAAPTQPTATRGSPAPQTAQVAVNPLSADNDLAAPSIDTGRRGGTSRLGGESAGGGEGGAEIVVTGTHIRGTNPGAPPVQTITRADMERNGYATVADAVQALPANFGGTATAQSSTQFADRSHTNSTFATGVDLRGLGPGSTLVLVNGRRVAGAGAMGAFADVSLIPTGAVDRIEVLLDGASAIYGSDAVGGVVNIIMRNRFDGLESRLRLGTVTSGSKHDIQIDQTAGKQWSTGGFMLSYEFDRQGALRSADRGFATSADSRPYGGTDHRYYFSTPGNILGFDPATGSFGPTYAIPANQNGTGLTPASFLAGVTNLDNFRANLDLIPRETRHSAYATLSQDLGDTLRFSADARYSRRQFDDRTLGAATIFDVTSANPYFVSPDSVTDDLVAYGFDKELGPERAKGYDEAIAATAGLDGDLGKGWKLRTYVGWSQEREFADTTNFENDASLAEALGSVPDDPTTVFNVATDGYFNPYGTGTSNSKAVLDFIGSGFITQRVATHVLAAHADADGRLLELPGGAVKMALGGDIRRETFRGGGEDFFATTTPQPADSVQGSRVVEAAFVELHVPIVGGQNALPLIRALDLSIATRIENYSDFGRTTNPKVGVSWMPAAGVVLRASYGTSFRAPNLTQLKSAEGASVTQLPRADGSTIAVIDLAGGNSSLKPEIAKSWTAGADIRPQAIPALLVSGSWFRTVFSRRIDAPVTDNVSLALIDRTLAPFVELVSPSTSAMDLARVTALLNDPNTIGGTAIPASTIGAIIDGRYVNTGRIDTSGIDLSVHYSLKLGDHHFDLGAAGTYLIRYRERVTPTAPSADERNLAGYPVALKGRGTLGWSRGPFNSQIGLNYVNRYRDVSGNHIRSWTTFDLDIGYKAPQQSGWAKGFEASLSVQNLFDRSPPFYDSFVGAGYDAANANALKRFIALQLTKHW